MNWEIIFLLFIGFGILGLSRALDKLARRLEEISDQVEVLQSDFDDKFGKELHDHEFHV